MKLFDNRTRTPKAPAHVDVPVLVKIWQEDNVWNASAFDLKVAVFGDTFEEAQRNFEEALDAHFELLTEMGRAKEVVTRLRRIAEDRGYSVSVSEIGPRETIANFPIPHALEACAV